MRGQIGRVYAELKSGAEISAEISSATGINQSSVAEYLKRLEKYGFAARGKKVRASYSRNPFTRWRVTSRRPLRDEIERRGAIGG